MNGRDKRSGTTLLLPGQAGKKTDFGRRIHEQPLLHMMAPRYEMKPVRGVEQPFGAERRWSPVPVLGAEWAR